ncbi:MAG: LacI family DNA-binding transcriptional regulator [Cellulomonas sp.]|nr:LacI family DNA-binding transcriptional regulator [Cellulomonas sp.]
MSGRTTLADVAASAGVSVSTASLAFSGAGPISPVTRTRVLEAASALGYRGPNPLGRQLRSGRSGIVGVVVGDSLRRSFRDPVSIQVLDGLATSIEALGLGLLLVRGSDEPGADALNPLLATAAMDVAVILWGATTDSPVLTALRERGVPLVVVEGRAGEGNALVQVEDRKGMRALGEHLLALGHRRIATVTLPFDRDGRQGPADADRLTHVGYEIARRRLAGLHDAGIEPTTVYEAPASLVELGTAAGRELLARPDRPTAIAAQSDLLASGVLLAARELGLRVPQDVSVAGFDGLDLPWLAPDVLTSVHQPLQAKGELIGRAVGDLLAGEHPPTRTLDVELVVGTTTGPPPA